MNYRRAPKSEQEVNDNGMHSKHILVFYSHHRTQLSLL